MAEVIKVQGPVSSYLIDGLNIQDQGDPRWPALQQEIANGDHTVLNYEDTPEGAAAHFEAAMHDKEWWVRHKSRKLEEATFEYPAASGDFFSATRRTVQQLGDLIELGRIAEESLGAGNWSYPYPDITGADHVFTLSDLKAFAAALGQRNVPIIATANNHKAALKSKNTAQEVADYDATTGWPE